MQVTNFAAEPGLIEEKDAVKNLTKRFAYTEAR
jgi:hypothetical protein